MNYFCTNCKKHHLLIYKNFPFFLDSYLLAKTNYKKSLVLEILYSHDLIQSEEAAELSTCQKKGIYSK